MKIQQINLISKNNEEKEMLLIWFYCSVNRDALPKECLAFYISSVGSDKTLKDIKD